MNYLDIKKDLIGFEKEIGYKEVIKAIISYEKAIENEDTLNEIYEKYMDTDISIFSDTMEDFIEGVDEL